MANVSNLDMRDAKHAIKKNPVKYKSTCEIFDGMKSYPEDYATGKWDLGIQIVGEGKLKRVASPSHPIKMFTCTQQTFATVKLKESVDRSLVPDIDFILYIRDEGISQVSAISTTALNGKKAVGLKVLPDFRTDSVKMRINDQFRYRKVDNPLGANYFDIDPYIRYDRNENELEAHKSLLKQVNKFDDPDESSDDEGITHNSEHIFLIDRSQSMNLKM